MELSSVLPDFLSGYNTPVVSTTTTQLVPADTRRFSILFGVTEGSSNSIGIQIRVAGLSQTLFQLNSNNNPIKLTFRDNPLLVNQEFWGHVTTGTATVLVWQEFYVPRGEGRPTFWVTDEGGDVSERLLQGVEALSSQVRQMLSLLEQIRSGEYLSSALVLGNR